MQVTEARGKNTKRGEIMFTSHALEELEECTLGQALIISSCRCNLSDIPLPCLLIYKTFSSRKAFALKGVK